MGEIKFLNLESDKVLVKCIQKKESGLGNELTKKKIKKNLDRIDNIIIPIIKEIEIEKGHNLYEHGLELVEIAEMTAKIMNCSKDEIGLVGLAAYLHDIGKSKINKKILNKRGQLKLSEYKKIQKHVLHGKKIVMPFTYIGEIIACHHERYDGKGYIKGLKENEIPLGSRIIAIVDTYNAITHTRTYYAARPIEFAINELKRCSASEFDKKYLTNFRLNVLKQLAENSTRAEYKQKILAILCKKGEFSYKEERKKSIKELEKDYLETRLRCERQFDKLAVAAFLAALEIKKRHKKIPRFGYIEICR